MVCFPKVEASLASRLAYAPPKHPQYWVQQSSWPRALGGIFAGYTRGLSISLPRKGAGVWSGTKSNYPAALHPLHSVPPRSAHLAWRGAGSGSYPQNGYLEHQQFVCGQENVLKEALPPSWLPLVLLSGPHKHNETAGVSSCRRAEAPSKMPQLTAPANHGRACPVLVRTN